MLLLPQVGNSQPKNLELDDQDDIDLLLEEFPDEEMADSSDDLDDLDTLKDDIGEIEFSLPEEESKELKQAEEVEQITRKSKPKTKIKRINPSRVNKRIVRTKKLEILKENDNSREAKIIFQVGKAEKDLLKIAKNMQGKIPDSDWNDIAGKSTSGTYEVVSGDWLWKISKSIFGSGFYYSKIWALNPYITNPHEIEPGMILSFSTGSDNQLPSIDLARYNKIAGGKNSSLALNKYNKWGDDTKPAWISEKERLEKDGVYIQYGTAETEKDLDAVGKQNLIKEYEVYEPPGLNFSITAPAGEFDEQGFDKNAKVKFNFNEGFHLTTFLSTNVVQDFGKIESSYEYQGIFTNEDKAFIRFDEKIDVAVGDKFSTYTAAGSVTNKNSDRTGYKYSITGAFETVQKHEKNLWEVKIVETTGVISRGDRVTVYTPKIEMITKTYNSRLVEAIILAGFYKIQSLASLGDVIYLDRGRADGIEIGNVFEVYGFRDRNTGKNISDNPTYKNGELTVITVTDNFATALVTRSVRDFIIGDIAVTKTREAAARVTKLKKKVLSGEANRISDAALDELDVELNLDDLNDALLNKADKIQFTEDELAELERQEREKSIMSNNEKDLRSLERLESDLESAEKIMIEAKLDEDKLLEGESLNKLEKDFNVEQQESLDELEENFGKRFLDEDLNDKENPYGLTEFDIEEIDELLNVEKDTQ